MTPTPTPSSPPSPLPPLAICTVGVIGLGYVGLPLAACFASTTSSERNGEPLQRRVIGYDVNAARVEELRQGHDRTRELSAVELQQALAAGLELSTNPADLAAADVFIVTVPTPIDSAKRPDLTPLHRATQHPGGGDLRIHRVSRCHERRVRAAAGAAQRPGVQRGLCGGHHSAKSVSVA